MTIRVDPSRAPTRADAAYDRALDKKEARAEIIYRECKRHAENMMARQRGIGVGWSQYHLDACKAHNEAKREALTPLQYLRALMKELADEAFEQLQSPEDAADDEWFREGDAKQERD
ncbi:MAG: hypothetical protein KAH44_31835 [Oricola sp.]|jgi:hypothetical protein|nr:hypothetical protein [Oricola sp.]